MNPLLKALIQLLALIEKIRIGESSSELSVIVPKVVESLPPGSFQSSCPKVPEGIINFAVGSFAGASSMCFIQPVDFLKVRIQLAGEKGENTNPIKIARKVIKDEGIKSFQKGIDASIWRQVVFTGFRFGLFKSLNDWSSQCFTFCKDNSLLTKMVTSSLAGAIAAQFSNPMDTALVRMQGDDAAPIHLKKGYKTVGRTLAKIYYEEGLPAWFNGVEPNMIRAILLNGAALTSNEVIADQLRGEGQDDASVRVISSNLSGCLASIASLPADNCKCRLQNMRADKNGDQPQTGLVDVFLQAMRTNPLSLQDGMPIQIMRVMPQQALALIINNFINDWRVGEIQNKK